MENSKNRKNKTQLDNDMSLFEKFEQEFKNIIFGVLFVILSQPDDSVFWAVVLGFIEFFQILIFPFHPAVSPYLLF